MLMDMAEQTIVDVSVNSGMVWLTHNPAVKAF